VSSSAGDEEAPAVFHEHVGILPGVHFGDRELEVIESITLTRYGP
jgi:hypothetical protein